VVERLHAALQHGTAAGAHLKSHPRGVRNSPYFAARLLRAVFISMKPHVRHAHARHLAIAFIIAVVFIAIATVAAHMLR
jgi:hypothetical protein